MEYSGELRKFAMSQSFDGKHAVCGVFNYMVQK